LAPDGLAVLGAERFDICDPAGDYIRARLLRWL